MTADSKKGPFNPAFFNPDFFATYDERDHSRDRQNNRPPSISVDSTNWTGLAKAASPIKIQVIREKSLELQVAIMQSDADLETKSDACKRVEAVIILLEAPNVPWKEVVGLLNHPTVTAFLAAVSLIQFIIGLAA